jgi:hypothetical protein
MERRRSAAPTGLAAMAAVIVVVLVWWLLSGNGPRNPQGNGGRLAVPDSEVTGAVPSEPPALSNENGVRIDGFVREAGSRIALNYTTGAPECSGTLTTPEVLETSAAVTVTLTLRPPEQPPEDPCPDLARLSTVRVELGSPLGDRSVLDGSFAQPVRVTEVQRPNE